MREVLLQMSKSYTCRKEYDCTCGRFQQEEKIEVIEALLVSQVASRDGVGVPGSQQVCRVKSRSTAGGQG